jgi:CDP-diacylglycerol--glycerol-3-phosphate 3-phosphatidyltransferase
VTGRRLANQNLVSAETRQAVRARAVPVAVALGRAGLTPNALTVIGFLGTAIAAVTAAAGWWLLAGVLVIAFGIFDLFDGALARATGRATPFGAFLDSTLDRTGENLVYAGVAVGGAAAGDQLVVIAAVLALSFASVVTYTRARAEAVGLHGEVGVAPRPERLVVLAAALVLAGLPGGFLGSGLGWLAAGLLLIFALSAVTVVQRIVHTHDQLDTHS